MIPSNYATIGRRHHQFWEAAAETVVNPFDPQTETIISIRKIVWDDSFRPIRSTQRLLTAPHHSRPSDSQPIHWQVFVRLHPYPIGRWSLSWTLWVYFPPPDKRAIWHCEVLTSNRKCPTLRSCISHPQWTKPDGENGEWVASEWRVKRKREKPNISMMAVCTEILNRAVEEFLDRRFPNKEHSHIEGLRWGGRGRGSERVRCWSYWNRECTKRQQKSDFERCSYLREKWSEFDKLQMNSTESYRLFARTSDNILQSAHRMISRKCWNISFGFKKFGKYPVKRKKGKQIVTEWKWLSTNVPKKPLPIVVLFFVFSLQIWTEIWRKRSIFPQWDIPHCQMSEIRS